MAKLCNCSEQQVLNNKFLISQEKAAELNAYIVLKGPFTLTTTPEKKQFVNCSGNQGLAKGGSGDVLLGLISYFVAKTLKSGDKFGDMMNEVYQSNKSERFVGYFTKGGDNVCDIAPIADLYVDEVIKVGDYLGVPKEITHKIPDDGLSGISDEEKMGFSYDDVKKVSLEIETGIKNNNINPLIREKIIKMHEANLHKFYTPFYNRSK